MKKLMTLVVALASACAFGWSWSGKTGDVTLTEDATIAAADKADVEALTGIEIPEGIKLTVTGATGINLSAKLSGNGAFETVENASITISGDNSAFTGTMDFANDKTSSGTVTVTSRHGLGAAKMKDGTTQRFIWSHFPTLRFSGDALTCDVGIYWRAGRNVSNTFTASSDAAVFNAPIYDNQSGWVENLYVGNWTFNAGFGVNGANGNPHFYFPDGVKLYVNNERFVTGLTYGMVNLLGSSELHLNTPDKGPTGGQMAVSGSGRLVCDCVDTLKGGDTVYLGNSAYKSGTIDLNGFDQTLPAIRHSTTWKWTPVKGDAAYVSITSAVPATLTETANVSHSFACRYRGAVSLTKNGTGTKTLVNQVSDTTGTLTVNAGTVALDWGAAWEGDVAVGAAGAFSVSKDSRLSAKATSKITVAEGGTIKVDGVLMCGSLKLGETVVTEGTVVTAADYPDYILGDGRIFVVRTFAAADVFTWSGSSASAPWGEATTWTPNGVPDAGDKVVIPANAQVNVLDTDKAVIESISAIQLDAGSVLALSNKTDVLVLTADLSGAGSFKSEGGNRSVELKGVNLAHVGPMKFRQTPVIVSARYGLGNPCRTVEHWNIEGLNASARAPLRFRGAGLTNDVPFSFTGQVLDSNYYFTDALSDPWVQGGVIDYLQTSDCPTIHLGSYTFVGGWQQTLSSPVYNIKANHTLTIAQTPISFTGSGAWYTFALDSGATLLLNVATNVWNSKFGWYGAGKIMCGVANALCPTAPLNMAYASTTANLDLNGLDQEASHLSYCTGPSWSHKWGSGPTSESTGHGIITSAAPATLTLSGKTSSLAPVKFTGAVSVLKTGAATQTIVNMFSDSTGTLTVTNGTVAFKWGAGWGGSIHVADASKVSFADKPKDRMGAATVDAGGTLEVADGAKIKLAALTLGATKVPDGEYTAEQLNALVSDGNTYAAGGGQFRIGKLGGVVIIR